MIVSITGGGTVEPRLKSGHVHGEVDAIEGVRPAERQQAPALVLVEAAPDAVRLPPRERVGRAPGPHRAPPAQRLGPALAEAALERIGALLVEVHGLPAARAAALPLAVVRVDPRR